jgi:uncharacterized protein DUF6134
MHLYRIPLGALVAWSTLFAADAHAASDATTVNFAVLRDGTQIGTNSVRFGHCGRDTTVKIVTHVEIGLGFLTLYKFDQTEAERWADGRLVAMNSTTDDNGTLHRTNAAAGDGKIIVKSDGQERELAPTAIPLSLWNPAVVAQKTAIDPKDGSVQPVKIVDRGEDDLIVRGHAQHAHHYEIITTFSQDVWYDENDQLVQVELKAIDGSTIRYQLV